MIWTRVGHENVSGGGTLINIFIKQIKYWPTLFVLNRKAHTSALSPPVPSWPNWLPPKEYTSPDSVVHTVCHNPAATDFTHTPPKEDI